MSTTTNFKRIALVAVAALGLGVLSSVPSQAAVSLSVTSTDGTATTALSDTTTAATVAVSLLKTEANDKAVISIALKSRPTGAPAITPVLQYQDTDTVNSGSAVITTGASTANKLDTVTTGSFILTSSDSTTASTKYVGANFRVYLNTGAASIIAGTYVVTVLSTPYNAGTVGTSVQKDVSIVVSEPVRTASASYSTAYIAQGTSFPAGQVVDSTVAVTSTASSTVKGIIKVTLASATNTTTYAAESITVTTTAGTVGTTSNGGSLGRSVVFAYTAGTAKEIGIFSDGTAGTATITISTPSFTFPTKTVTFYSTTPAKITAAAYTSVIGTTATAGVWAQEFDSLNNNFGSGTDLYAYSSDTSVVSNYGTLCATYDATNKLVVCALTGLKDGTANITIRDAATVALSTVASNAVAVRVTTKSAAKATIAFDKTSYAPGEKVTVLVKLLDVDGKVLPAAAYTSALGTGGIVTDKVLGAWAAGETLTATTINLASAPVATTNAPVVSLDPVAQFTYYLPMTGGAVKFSTTGGTSLALAGQVAVSASANVVDSGAAALAAVTALATTVASLKTLIVTLTNLVLKIQKKVKA